jgi:hypothetical protein
VWWLLPYQEFPEMHKVPAFHIFLWKINSPIVGKILWMLGGEFVTIPPHPKKLKIEEIRYLLLWEGLISRRTFKS